MIVTQTKLTQILPRLRKGRKIIFTNGVFDILHAGHVSYLTKAKSLGDFLIVGLNTDSSVRRLKGPTRPLQPQKDRALLLDALRMVDFVVLFRSDTPLALIRALRPDVLVKGADYERSEIVGSAFVESYGGQVRRIRLTPGRSSSRLLAFMRG